MDHNGITINKEPNIDVSVIMITYAHEEYIIEAIEGVISQEFSGTIELLISNDKSPDNTNQVITDFLSEVEVPKNIIIRYYDQEVNLGMMANFNLLLKYATGKYLAFCEGDDYWIDPKKVQMQYDILEKYPEYGLVSTNVNVRNEDDSIHEDVIGSKSYPIYLEFEKFLMGRGYMAPCSWLIRSDIFYRVYDYDHLTSDGSFFIFCSFLAASKVYFLTTTTAVYRILEESASHTKNVIKKIEREMGLYGTENYLISKYSKGLKSEDIHSQLRKRHIHVLAIIVFNRKKRSFEGEEYIKTNYPFIWKDVESDLKDIVKANFLPNKVINKFLSLIK